MGNYVDEADLLEVIKCYQADGSRGEELGEMILLIAEGITQRDHAKNAVDSSDAIAEAVTWALVKIQKYDVAKGKAFSFLTRLMINKIADVNRTERAHRNKITMLKTGAEADPVVKRQAAQFGYAI